MPCSSSWKPGTAWNVQHAEQARLELIYDPDVVNATELQGLIEAAGGEVITIDPE